MPEKDQNQLNARKKRKKTAPVSEKHLRDMHLGYALLALLSKFFMMHNMLLRPKVGRTMPLLRSKFKKIS